MESECIQVSLKYMYWPCVFESYLIPSHLQKEHSSSIRVSRESLKLMRALAGNDAVKNNILKDGIAKLIDEIINIHKVSV